MSDDIVTELRAHRDIDTNQCCECYHWTDHDHNCMVGRAADEIERLRDAGDVMVSLMELSKKTWVADTEWDVAVTAWKEARRG